MLPPGEKNNSTRNLVPIKAVHVWSLVNKNFLQKVTFESLNMGGTPKEGCCLCLVQLEDVGNRGLAGITRSKSSYVFSFDGMRRAT